jgi:hypothetical protein
LKCYFLCPHHSNVQIFASIALFQYHKGQMHQNRVLHINQNNPFSKLFSAQISNNIIKTKG